MYRKNEKKKIEKRGKKKKKKKKKMEKNWKKKIEKIEKTEETKIMQNIQIQNSLIFPLKFEIFSQIGFINQFLYNSRFTNRVGLELLCCFLNGANSGMKSTLI